MSRSKRGSVSRPPSGAVTRRGRPGIDSAVPSPRGRDESSARHPAARGSEPNRGVAFLGLGSMGRAMVSRLLESGLSVRVYNRSRGPARELAALGAVPCTTPRDCARGADIVITMVSDAEALASVLEGADGVLAQLGSTKSSPRPVLLDMSTIGRSAALAVGRRAEEHGARFVDAPVSGSIGPARRGELLALVGGSIRSVERVRPILEVLCKRLIPAGGIGQGQALKVVLNGIGAHHLVAFTSMLALGEGAGLARDVLLDAFTTGAFATPSYIAKREKLLARDYAPEFALALAAKDCALNIALQDEVGLRLPVHRAITDDVERAVRAGLGELDLFALEKAYRSR